MLTWIKFLKPPKQWLIAVIVLLGTLCGLVFFIFHISKASSYLSDDPQTCINCHVMFPQYATWQRSSHKSVATCVDCHVPHDNILHKYEFKMKDGMRHATMFTMRKEPQVIRIKPAGAEAVQENCVRCHKNVIRDVSLQHATYEGHMMGETKLCWDCHREVPHGRVRSLSATPQARVPKEKDMVPEWMRGLYEKLLNSPKEASDEENR